MSPCCRCGAAHADGARQGPAPQPMVHSTGVPRAAPLHRDQGRGRVKPLAAFTHTAAHDGRVAEGLRPQLRPCKPGLWHWGTGGTRRACCLYGTELSAEAGENRNKFIFFKKIPSPKAAAECDETPLLGTISPEHLGKDEVGAKCTGRKCVSCSI